MSWNPITWFQTEAPIIEQDVLNFISKVETGIHTLVTDAEGALSWVAAQTPAIAKDLQVALGFVSSVPGVVANPEVAAAIAAANIAMQGLNAFANTYNQSTSGGVTLTAATQAVVAGYQAVKSAQAATATVAKTAVSATSTAQAANG